MKYKILVLGSNGMAGHCIKKYLENLNFYSVWGLARKNINNKNIIELDVTNLTDLQSIFEKHSFDYVINCIGLLNDKAEKSPDLGIWYNSYLPNILSFYGKKNNFKLIHISTDCVFSGLKGNYKENSFKDAQGVYAQTKSLGEVIKGNDLTLRTSIVGPELKLNGIGLFHWFMNQSGKINGYKRVFWSGITTIELSKIIHLCIQKNIRGLYQLSNNNKINKYDLLQLFNKYFKNNELIINSDSLHISDKSLINSRTDFDFKIPKYEKMIIEMKGWIIDNKDIYRHYKF